MTGYMIEKAKIVESVEYMYDNNEFVTRAILIVHITNSFEGELYFVNYNELIAIVTEWYIKKVKKNQLQDLITNTKHD